MRARGTKTPSGPPAPTPSAWQNVNPNKANRKRPLTEQGPAPPPVSRVSADGSAAEKSKAQIKRHRKQEARVASNARKKAERLELGQKKSNTRGKHPEREERATALAAFLQREAAEKIELSPREQKRSHGKSHRHGAVTIHR